DEAVTIGAIVTASSICAFLFDRFGQRRFRLLILNQGQQLPMLPRFLTGGRRCPHFFENDLVNPIDISAFRKAGEPEAQAGVLHGAAEMFGCELVVNRITFSSGIGRIAPAQEWPRHEQGTR
ncbi:MAG: hypothetical protein KDE19_22680, partial [Caldilineaceae bacterium]|nr:hypothetical protein [Caldilineaceae bacterium]